MPTHKIPPDGPIPPPLYEPFDGRIATLQTSDISFKVQLWASWEIIFHERVYVRKCNSHFEEPDGFIEAGIIEVGRLEGGFEVRVLGNKG